MDNGSIVISTLMPKMMKHLGKRKIDCWKETVVKDFSFFPAILIVLKVMNSDIDQQITTNKPIKFSRG